MKRLHLSSLCHMVAVFMLCCVACNAAAQEFSIVITGDFESQCILPNEGNTYVDEFPHVLVACRESQVNYTAWFSSEDETAVGWDWSVTGAANFTFTGNVAQVTWGSGSAGEMTVTVTTSSGRECSFYQRVGLIEKPVAAAVTVPECVSGHNIYVCYGESVEFTDNSNAESSDIVGYYWEGCGKTASTHSFTLENVTYDCVVTHRVYNNCGCYDEEVFSVYVLDGEPLRIDCYGTACEGRPVTYHASSPSCDDYLWAIEGGTLVSGQHTADITVQWDSPRDGGYGVISLDGTACGGNACSNKLSVKIPIIQDGVSISGQTSVCEGEAVVYSVPLYGSTQYNWTITPSITPVLFNNANQIEYIFDSPDTFHISVKYKCDFLSCGEFHSDTLTVVVKPRLSITGDNEICLANPCSLGTSPSALATWTITDLGNNQVVYTSSSPEATVSTTFANIGRYRVTARHSDYCNEAEFFLTVKGTPPAPTVLDIDEDNPTIACLNSSISLKAHPYNPDYNIIWEPSCSTASPSSVTGNDVTITYTSQVCDVYAYTYDRRLQCRSSGHYTQPVSQFVLAPVTIASPFTVCPGAVITWGGNDVPYQDGVIYEWGIDDLKQYCATVAGSKFSNEITLYINDFDPLPTLPLPFYIYLYRTYCSGFKDTTTIQIIICDSSNATLSILPPNAICQNTQAEFIGSGCSNGASYVWHFPDAANDYGNPGHNTFHSAGNANVELVCNPYDACSNPNYLPSTTATVMVNPVPPAYSIGYDGTSVYIVPPLSTTDYSFQWGHTSTNSNTVPAIPGVTSYSCTVISNTRPYCEVVLYYNDVIPCRRLNVRQNVFVDYCNNTVSFEVLNPPSTINWSISGGRHGTPIYSGTYNEVVTFTVNSVGNFVVSASAGDDPCYTGFSRFSLDFLPSFTFEKNCTTIVVHNHSQYLDDSKQVTLSVNGISQYTFPLSQETLTVNTGSGGTFVFQLTDYDGHTLTCQQEIVTIANSSNSLVTITTSNTGNPTHTCDNTPIELSATIASPHTIVSSHWEFGDHDTYQNASSNSAIHTFNKDPNYNPYNIYVNVTDENGCLSIGGFTINSYNNDLKEEKLRISYQTPITCPGNNRNIEYLANSNPPSSATYNWSTPPSPNYTNIHAVTYTDDYSVVVTNSNYCEARASVNVPFLNKPTAIIIPEKYYYCSGETVKLFGEPDNTNSYQYLWTVTNSVTSNTDTYTSGTVLFSAPNSQCSLIVNLTVTDPVTHCTATADPVTIHIVPEPAAPTIDLSGDDYCIDDPPVLMKSTGTVTDLYWSNGAYGSSAYYYYPGPVTAYYYDMPSGCRSKQADFYIPSEPDFDALLTGCYKVCPDLAVSQLPVYGLLPVWQQFAWTWWFDEGGDNDNSNATYCPIALPLHGDNTYWLDVNYYSDCGVTSKPLVLEEVDEACKCNGIEVTYDYTCKLDGCKLTYDITVTVCNNSGANVCFPTLTPLFTTGYGIDIASSTFAPMTLLPDDCDDFHVFLEVTELVPTVVTFQLKDIGCSHCEKTFGINLTPKFEDLDIDCVVDATNAGVYLNGSLTGVATLYYDFDFDLDGLSSPTVVAVWSEPPAVINYSLGGTYLSGLGATSLGRVTPEDEICIYVLVCEEDVACLYKYCFFMDGISRGNNATSTSDDSDGAKATGGDANNPQLKPNPATGEVNVVGTADEVVEVLVMDMHGKKVAAYDRTARFNVGTLSSGTYIVRVKTKSDDRSPEKVTYLKLVKK